MGEFIHLQDNFSLGQLNEKLQSRVNSEVYGAAARKITNLVVTPEGGLLKRFGLEFGIRTADIEGDITSTNTQYVILETSPTEKLVIVFSPEKVNILAILPSGQLTVSETHTTPYDGTQVPELRFAQSRGVLLVFHEDVEIQRLAKLPTATDFTFGPVPIKNVPVFGFEEQAINDFTFSISNNGTFGRARTLTVSGTGSSTFFTDDFFGGLFVAEGGVMRMNANATGSTIQGDVVIEFNNKLGVTNIPGTEAFISQQAISDTRGFPKGGVFFDSRLWLIGLRSLPNAVFGSAVQDFFNFSTTTQNAGDAIDDILQAPESLTFLKGAIGNKTLITFTNDGPFATLLPLEGALTPTNTAFSVQGGQSISNLPALTLDNKVVFMSEGGKILWGMQYSEERRGYSIVNLSITGSDVLNNPVSTAIFKDEKGSNTSYALIVNEDGSMAIFTSDDEAKVNGWTAAITEGKFKSVFALGTFGFVVVERFGDLFIERIDFTRLMDSTVENTFSPAQTLVTGLSHLEGQVVEVIADNILLPINTTLPPGQPGSSIVKNGQIVLEKAASNIEAGLPFSLELVPLPVNVRTEVGDNLNWPKTTKYARVSFFESIGIKINGVLLRNQEFSATDFVNLAEPLTGSEKRKVSPGWDGTEANISITQDRALPCYIRAVDIQVEI